MQYAARLEQQNARIDAKRVVKAAERAEKITLNASEAEDQRKAIEARQIQEVASHQAQITAAARIQGGIINAVVDNNAQNEKDEVKN